MPEKVTNFFDEKKYINYSHEDRDEVKFKNFDEKVSEMRNVIISRTILNREVILGKTYKPRPKERHLLSEERIMFKDYINKVVMF